MRLLESWDDDTCEVQSVPKQSEARAEEVKARAAKSRQHRQEVRKAMSEDALYSVLDWHLEDGCAYHVISGGDVDSLSFLRAVLKQHPLDYALISTWCMAMDDAEEVESWLERGLIKRLDVYVGEIFIQHYLPIFEHLEKVVPRYGGRLCMQRNHAKVMLAYWQGGACAITSSANVNTNPRIEQTVITCDRGVADFYKGFFDDLHPKNQWAYKWEPWTA